MQLSICVSIQCTFTVIELKFELDSESFVQCHCVLSNYESCFVSLLGIFLNEQTFYLYVLLAS